MHRVPLPARHVAASRLVWRIANALATRGWCLTNLSVSRRWRFRFGSPAWTARAHVSLFCDEPSPRFQGLVCSIELDGKSAMERSLLVRDLRDRLGASYEETGKHLMGGVRGETRPRALLAELDRIARVFGDSDSHPSPRSRARTPSARLWTIAEAVVAHGTWSLETPSMRLPPRLGAYASISPIPASACGRPELSSHLFVSDGRGRAGMTDLVARADSHGYADHAGKRHPHIALMKVQPLSAKAATREAMFLEAEIDRFSRG